jgi:ABC-type transport system substrate-binding protein
MSSRRGFIAQTLAAAGTAAIGAPQAQAQNDGGRKVVRWSFPAAETGFDPAQVSDLYSNTVIPHIIEAPLQYDFLANPVQLKPRTAAAMPEVSADARTFTVRLRPGIYFQDDPLFKGQRREMVAADCIYQFKRCFDPRWKSPHYPTLIKSKPLGLEELRKQAQATGKFDYDADVPGARVLDRYTFQITLADPNPRFILNFQFANYFGAVAREIVEALPEAEVMARPVGTGPFRLAQWRRASFIALERSPTFRDEFYDANPAADDAEGQEILKKLKGKKLPLIDRLEISIINETQPQWLAFLNGQLDLGAPGELLNTAAPSGKLAPALAKQGIQLKRVVSPALTYTYFNMNDPLVGGYEPHKVALRRAVATAYLLDIEIRDVRRGQLIPAQSIIPPGVYGFDPTFVTRRTFGDAGKANALLDLYGYKDVNGDGWRETPDGKPLLLEYATQPDQLSRSLNEIWRKSMNAIGVRVDFKIAPFPENLKNARAGKLMMWGAGWTAATSDGEYFFDIVYGPNAGGANASRFNHPDFNRLFQQQKSIPDGPERLAVMTEMKKILAAYQPLAIGGHPIINTFVHPWLIGYRRHPFGRDAFKWVDIDIEHRQRVLS